jgi:CRISPR-associated protein Csm1
MLIAGKLSGIQDFLFDVVAEGGAQAKRLRARSFFIQLLTEALCLRVADALQLDLQGSLVFCNAGKFLLCGKGSLENLRKVESEINEELLRIGTGKLSFALAVVEEESNSVKDDYQMIMRRLNFAKKRAWMSVCAPEGKWKTEKLQLQPINPPCDLCRQEKAEREDLDEEIVRRVCKTCHDMRRIGEQLTREQNKWIILSPSQSGEFSIGSWSFDFRDKPAISGNEYAISLAGSAGTAPQERILQRRLVRHIPRKDRGPVEFVELAERAKGDRLLGLLKMDADHLGQHIHDLLAEAHDLSPLSSFSRELDDFFAETLTAKMKEEPWRNLYTIFAGGDDLMIVGAWNEAFDFAAEIQKAFAERFSSRGLTLSGGLAIFKPKLPIKTVAAEADELLFKAKETLLSGEEKSRDQFAGFGQVWKWRDHKEIAGTAKSLVRWIEEKRFKRGWLHTLLRLAMQRQAKPQQLESRLATAHLAYFWTRNFDPKDREVWEFGKKLVNHFDALDTVEAKYLPAITRYALAATRSKEER